MRDGLVAAEVEQRLSELEGKANLSVGPTVLPFRRPAS
jgi:hypothetical protein